MNPNAPFERELERWLEASARRRPPVDLHSSVIERARTMRQRPRWIAVLRDLRPQSPTWGSGRPAVVGYLPIVLALLLALIVGALVVGALRSQLSRESRWSVTGTMVKAHVGHTATLLSDGRVLIVDRSAAEIYDPAHGTWTPTAPMRDTFDTHVATLLSDGRVLVVGGGTAEVYEPANGSWTATGKMVDAEAPPRTATLLGDGRVLVAGSLDGLRPSASAELFDPRDGTWTATGPMPKSIAVATATLLLSGKVLMAGGCDTAALTAAELYDPVSGTWAATGSMSTARAQQVAILLRDGDVLVAGGLRTNMTPLASAELYDPTRGTWTDTGDMSAPASSGHSATLLPDGKVLLVGGLIDAGRPLGSPAQLYDPVSRSWTDVAPMVTPTSFGQTATLLRDGAVLVAGGSDGKGGELAAAELFVPGSP